MCHVTVRLFGQFQAQRDDQDLPGWNARRMQELFAYLLLHRDHLHARAVLAEQLWPESTTDQSMKHLRHALWQLQTALGCSVLQVDAEMVSISLKADLWLDVARFELACAQVRGIPGAKLSEGSVRTLQEALELYRGDLLEGWYQDWCLFERERLQRMYLALLEKQMAYCEAHGEYERGLECGTCVLRYDSAHERTHRRLMRLYFLAGDRTAALRQYQRCEALLREELEVEPSERTVALYEQIRSGRPAGPNQTVTQGNGHVSEPPPTTLDQALLQLKRLQRTLAVTERRLAEVIHLVEDTSNGHH